MCSKPSPIHEASPHLPLSLDAFEESLDRYGADLARWPAGQRAAAEQLLAHSAVAKATWDDARMVDSFLETRTASGQQSDLVERVLAAQRAHDAAQAAAGFMPRRVTRPGLLQAALLCGVFLLCGATAGIFLAPDPVDYDVSGIFLFSSDLFYI